MQQHPSPNPLVTGDGPLGLHLMRQAQLCYSGASPSSAQQQQNRGLLTRSPSWSSLVLAPASPRFQALLGTRSISVSGNVDDDPICSPDAHAHVDAQFSNNQSPPTPAMIGNATSMSFEETPTAVAFDQQGLPATNITGVDLAPPSPYSPAAASPVRQASQLQVPGRPNCVPKTTRFAEAISRMVEAEQRSALHGKPSTTPMRRLFPQEQAVGPEDLPSNPRVISNSFGLMQRLTPCDNSLFPNLTNSRRVFGGNDDFYRHGTHDSSMPYMWNQEDCLEEAMHDNPSAAIVSAPRSTMEVGRQGFQTAGPNALQYPPTSMPSILQVAAHAPLETPDSVRRCISSVEANGHALGVCPSLVDLPGWAPKPPM